MLGEVIFQGGPGLVQARIDALSRGLKHLDPSHSLPKQQIHFRSFPTKDMVVQVQIDSRPEGEVFERRGRWRQMYSEAGGADVRNTACAKKICCLMFFVVCFFACAMWAIWIHGSRVTNVCAVFLSQTFLVLHVSTHAPPCDRVATVARSLTKKKLNPHHLPCRFGKPSLCHSAST